VSQQDGRGVLGGDETSLGKAPAETLVQGGADSAGVLGAYPGLHGGVNPARSVGVDGHPGPGQLGGEVHGVRLERGLGGGVGVAADHAGRMRNDRARDVHDAAPAGVEHAGKEDGGQRGRRDDVDLERQPQIPGRDPGRAAKRLYRGRIVDQDVDSAGGQRGSHGTVAVLLVGEIDWHHADPPSGDALPAEQVTGLIQLRAGAGEQDDVGAGGRQAERDGPADAAAGPGDKRGLAGEVSCHCGLLDDCG
jgi:hypothetical protein